MEKVEHHKKETACDYLKQIGELYLTDLIVSEPVIDKVVENNMVDEKPIRLCADLDVFLGTHNPSEPRPQEPNGIDPLAPVIKHTVEIDTNRSTHTEDRLADPPNTEPSLGLEKHSDIRRLFPFLRKLTEEELSFSQTQGSVLEGEPDVYHCGNPEQAKYGVPVHLPRYLAKFSKLKHEPMRPSTPFVMINLIIGDCALDGVLLDSGAYHNLMPARIFYGLGLRQLEPVNENVLLADGSISKPPLGLARNVKCRVADYVYELDFLVCNVPLGYSVSFTNRVILGMPFLGAPRAVIDFGSGWVSLTCKSNQIVFRNGSFPGGCDADGRQNPPENRVQTVEEGEDDSDEEQMTLGEVLNSMRGEDREKLLNRPVNLGDWSKTMKEEMEYWKWRLRPVGRNGDET